MIDGIFLQGKALLTKEILQNDDKKQRYGNGSEPFIQAVASRYCFASPCDGEAGGCGRSSTVKVQTSETGTFLHRTESLRGIGRGSCRLFRLWYDDCCRHCPRRYCKQFQTCLSMECIAGLHANDEDRRAEQSESPHMSLTGMDAAGRTLRIFP